MSKYIPWWIYGLAVGVLAFILGYRLGKTDADRWWQAQSKRATIFDSQCFSGPAVTLTPNSPAVTGSGNTIIIDGRHAEPKEPRP